MRSLLCTCVDADAPHTSHTPHVPHRLSSSCFSKLDVPLLQKHDRETSCDGGRVTIRDALLNRGIAIHKGKGLYKEYFRNAGSPKRWIGVRMGPDPGKFARSCIRERISMLQGLPQCHQATAKSKNATFCYMNRSRLIQQMNKYKFSKRVHFCKNSSLNKDLTNESSEP